MSVQIEAFFDPATFTYSYVVADPRQGVCAIIDSVLDYDAAAGRISHAGADRLIAYVRERGLTPEWLLETHAHADHLSAAAYLQAQLGGRIAIGAGITQVQRTFARLFNCAAEMATDGSQFDRLLADGDVLPLGDLQLHVLHTPGHTPGCVSYRVEDAVFVGDTLFMPDYGTARCDFPGGDAHQLYRSIRRLYALPDSTRLFMCHDYKAPGRETFRFETTVGEQRRHNVHLHDGVDEQSFVAMRQARDASLNMPVLILPAIQMNMRAGHRPPAESNGVHYLKIPLDQL
ncbi:MBL fold metallo-hydrolase [Pseudomonas panipatensis]|uniref:Glyoxylase, beta-lactamase superfamily II n=1 Tax=Pseudomonas panipatensis TaxID=428992 RepID=A0A1G8G7A4_9PSED|nr:MBL fold metallo-hydrolase [Pseudomonas panipatensis]SDH90298.1 Glyoxylase, beta-lactamase superfamily II [Pseudomonas panipatensis]SMP44944.1 Glyoxylase, beta-lactamase superfamily II [Pseudomonas panipatensis]